MQVHIRTLAEAKTRQFVGWRRADVCEVVKFIAGVPMKCLFAFALQSLSNDRGCSEQTIETDLSVIHLPRLVCPQAIRSLRALNCCHKFVFARPWIQLLVRQFGKTLLTRPLFHVIRVNQP